MKEPTQNQPKLYISRDQYQNLAFEVCQSISPQSLARGTVVVGIANGGILFAEYLAVSLDLPLTLIHPNTKPLPIQVLNVLEGRSVLLVDDISDSGETLRFWRDYLMSRGCSVKIATLFERKGTKVHPDFVGQQLESQDWLVFWWEPEFIWTEADIQDDHII